MGRHTVFSVVALTLVWMILTEDVSVAGVLTGIFVSIVALFFILKFLPFKEISNINFYKLATFPFYLIGQIYVAGFQIIRVIVRGPKVDIVTIKTKIEAEALKVILVDSITLMPGSILLNLSGNNITLLWIREKNTKLDISEVEAYIEEKLERRLLRAQRDTATQ